MPANPGAKRATEKAKKRRAQAQNARAKQQAAAIARAPKVDDQEVGPEASDAGDAGDAIGSPFSLRGNAVIDFDALDALSAEVPPLLKKKKIDEAARVCADMVRRFPGEPDGWQRFSAVWEARGDLAKALADMERAAARVSKDDDVSARPIEVELERLRKAVARLA